MGGGSLPLLGIRVGERLECCVFEFPLDGMSEIEFKTFPSMKFGEDLMDCIANSNGHCIFGAQYVIPRYSA